MAKRRYKQENEAPMQVQEPVVAYQRTNPVETKNVSDQNEGLNAAQLHFLRILRFIKTKEELDELSQVVSDYYMKKAQAEADRLWDEGVLGDFLLNEHMRTPYKY